MKKVLLICMLLTMVIACAKQPSPQEQAPARAEQKVGGDRDEHGCIPSAGYSWCERTARCERPWELAKEKGFPNTQEGFATFCTGK